MCRYIIAYPGIKFRFHFSSGSLVIANKPNGKADLRYGHYHNNNNNNNNNKPLQGQQYEASVPLSPHKSRPRHPVLVVITD
jgi:hypothetical protein